MCWLFINARLTLYLNSGCHLWSFLQWGGGLQGHVGVPGLVQEAHAAEGPPSPPRAPSHADVRGSLLDGQQHGEQGGSAETPEPHLHRGKQVGSLNGGMGVRKRPLTGAGPFGAPAER